ncbi:MAG: hypothetical protein ACKOXP_01095 [Flavobacteriales bacterium]
MMNGQFIQTIIGGLVVVTALLFAGLLAFTNVIDYMIGWRRTMMIILLIMYAFYRFTRVYQSIKRQKMKSNED